jgi:hypothetical protein
VNIAKALHVPKNRIIFVPGNHDKNWTVEPVTTDDEPVSVRLKRYAPLRQPHIIFEKVLKLAKRHMFRHPAFSIWTHNDLFVVGCNTAWHDGPNHDVHHGLVNEETLAEIDDYLTHTPQPKTTLKLFLVHHHPVQYSNPIPDEPDFSIMVNAANFLSLLSKHEFDMLIHGHKHKPHFRTEIINSSFPLAILGAGSFSVELDTRWSGLVNNQFHLVRIAGRDTTSTCVYGEVQSWAYLYGQDWIPSQKSNGIKHILPFGAYIHPPALRNRMRDILNAKFTTKAYVEWPEILEEEPQLQYVEHDRLHEVICHLETELNLHRYGELPDALLLKKG